MERRLRRDPGIPPAGPAHQPPALDGPAAGLSGRNSAAPTKEEGENHGEPGPRPARLPETDPVGVEGEAFNNICECIGLATLLDTICIGVSCS
ncbi:VenA family class IV lanthipeptide [Streptomyces sp. NPDC048718]|uniref:VenA family class IV lanthipeptide n=1 Tax=Streptomyces sp. NPDC048718 TaxID=3365587 RepID=UPI003710E22D